MRMKFALVGALALPLFVSAHHPENAVQHRARASTVTLVAGSASSSASGALTVPASSSTESLTFSLLSTNPTAVPLVSIVSNASTQTTHAISTTYPADATQTWVPSAPALPNAASLKPSNYPALDKTPPTDSDEVKAWIEEVYATGIEIPDIPVTNLGGCGNNTAAAANSSRCWWTCGGCTRDVDVTTCPTKEAWGLTYDDGPSPYTPDLLSYFDQKDLRGTFFVVGSRAISRPAMLQDEYMMGNQIAVHTWSHPYMTTKTNEEVIAELGWTKKIIKDALGVTPIYWRPPYGDIDDRVRAIGLAMNLYPVIWTRISKTQTFDTGDYTLPSGSTTAVEVLNNWEAIMNNSSQIDTGFIVLEHDLFQQTVDIAVGYILPQALAHTPSFNITPVIECQDMPLSNAYIETNDNSTNTLPLDAAKSIYPTNASATAAAASASAEATGASGSSSAAGSEGSTSSGVSTSDAQGSTMVNAAVLTTVLSLVAGMTALLL
ncbi:carbohydrate esterase family 4 protein [Laetiporus sulphureus 93-53]|uniref:chitin deacetylase n=1 Tax=Laetiporus sulphureus 93-53 TaxID=1314785 RepID=A0A165E685_9APHY|nr:carbohydrate esterase family 4 protein [Laetiporus sulphureus 93-53]KZT06315.1 carbohydrate esterase family 4 protein [Laetiporus sulphureus 93-53]